MVTGAVPRSAPRCQGLTAPCRRIGRVSLVRVLSWWSLPVWARGRQITPEPLRYRQRGGRRGPGLPFRAYAFWLRRDAARRPGRQASRPRTRSDTPLHTSRRPTPPGSRPPRTEPGLPGTLAEPWRRLTARKRGKQLSPKTHRIAL